ncbi:hypothetical protein ACJRO7_027081 [Eucalyptus globulus]|uniref:K Homology domain-containing protein n=1 Tax=Eucalyptus globulus TaxID=34317 RepID=A0ABD3JRD5_EUCGL
MGSSFLTPPAKRRPMSQASAASMPDPSPSLPAAAAAAAAAKRSRAPPPPLSVPPGHAAFRLLCHASRIGGVIGKSGATVKHLQQLTGARIRVEDAPQESPDRVITVIAPSAVAAKVSVSVSPDGGGEGRDESPGASDGSGDVEGKVEVSKAQEALVKVFERILEVAAESNGVGVGVGVVSCRVLAGKSQAGSVIGKGGKTVEKIRKESGCKIRVLTEQLPACASAGEEMIEIEGGVHGVKKALVAVSGCLQECPPADKIPDKARTTGGRTIDSLSLHTSPEIYGDLRQRNTGLSAMPSGAVNYGAGVHPLAVEVDRAPTIEAKALKQEVSYRILCSNDRVGGVIGRGGSIVKALQNESGASISVGPTVAESDERLITIMASENPESHYSPAQRAVVLVFKRSIEAGTEKGLDSGSGPVTARLVVPSNLVGCLLGKGGSIVTETRRITGTNIWIMVGDQVPKCASEDDGVVQISGEFSNVQNALYNITGRLRDNIISSSSNNLGSRTASSVLAESSPYGRQKDPVALGLDTSSGDSPGLSRYMTLTASTDQLELRHHLDHPSAPRLWTSQGVAGVPQRSNSDVGRGLQGVAGVPQRSNSDVGRGLTSLRSGTELGSGSKSAIVTNTTVEIVVPENVIHCVYGENGSNLSRLRQISGAKVTVHEPRLGKSESTIVISGTPDEAQAAQSLLHAFILTGS